MAEALSGCLQLLLSFIDQMYVAQAILHLLDYPP
jgi:hypothetical protein